MHNENIMISVDEIIASLPDLNKNERTRLYNALFELQNDLDLKQAIEEGLDDQRNGRVSAHNAVMEEIKATYN